MNEPTPVVMPQQIWNPNYTPPDLGGQAYTSMANSVSKAMLEGSADLKTTLQNAAGTQGLLQVMAGMKTPIQYDASGKAISGGQPMLDPEMMKDLATKSLPTQQKAVGMMMSSIMQQQQLQNSTSQQMNMLNQFANNPSLMRTKMNMDVSAGQRGPMPQTSIPAAASNQAPVQQPTANPQNPPVAQTRNAPTFSAPPGYQWTQGSHPHNPEIQLHYLHDPSGRIIQSYNPDGTIFR